MRSLTNTVLFVVLLLGANWTAYGVESHDTPAPIGLKPELLPSGSLLKTRELITVPGGKSSFSLGRIKKNQVGGYGWGFVRCSADVDMALYDRPIPAGTTMVIDSVSSKDDWTTFKIASDSILKTISCNSFWWNDDFNFSSPAMEHLACFFDVRVLVPLGVENPPLSCRMDAADFH